ncbi:MAG: EAL domain-containing response regulator [Quisquiliibacterium sp.]
MSSKDRPPQELLVLDDEPEICHMVETVARQYGFVTSSAVDPALVPAQAFERADLLVLDLMMPGVDGIEVLRQLDGCMPLPGVVLISGLDRRVLESASQIAKAQGLQVHGVLKKPFRTRDLAKILDSYLNASDKPVDSPVLGDELQFTEFDIQEAITRDQFLVEFQPQVSLRDNSWVGVEALARWLHPEHGLLYPGAFIATAESAAVALAFTEHVIGIALRQFGRLAAEVGFQGSLSVNIPPTALTDVQFPDRLLPALAECGVAPDTFVLEMTENSLPENDQVVLDILTRLSMRGVSVSIDDFGTGKSSLERLQGAPFNELKIDMVFVQNAQTEPSSAAIVESAVSLGRRLNMNVVAEGVETCEAAQWLHSIGCGMAQGYRFGRPMTLDKLVAWAADRPDSSGATSKDEL